jgi:deoxyribodipyrimidine photo-lyase
MTGGRVNRFNVIKQSRDYDQYGEYVRLWLPELKDLPLEFIHEPWKMTQLQQIEFNCHIGVDYPKPIIPPMAYNSSGKPGTNRGDSGGVSAYVEKRRQPNMSNRNRHQKYEMGGLKESRYNF